MSWKSQGTSIYRQLPQQCRETLKTCEPLKEEIPQQFTSPIDYKPFKKS
jgi:phenylacetic acid degradation protein